MAALALQLLSLAMSLIMAVKNNPAAPAAQRAQAITTANYAIQIANQTLAALRATPLQSPVLPPALPAASSTPPVIVPQATSSLTVKVNSSIGSTLNLSPGASNQVIGSYLFSAAGPVAVNITTTTITLGPQAARTFSNIKLFSSGLQIGDTISSPTSTDAFSFTGRLWPLTVSPGTPTRVDVIADIVSGGSGMNPATTFAGCSAFPGTSTSSLPCNSVAGQSITVGSPSLGPLLNINSGIAPLVKMQTGQKIGSYLLAASLAEDIKLNSVTIITGSSPDILNVRVSVNGTPFGIMQTSSGGGTFIFYGTPVVIPAGSNSTVVDVYADVLIAPAAMSPATTFAGCTATGVLSGTAITCSSSLQGQSEVVAS